MLCASTYLRILHCVSVVDCPHYKLFLFTFSSFLILFSVRFFQLIYICVNLVPRILHDLFKHHYKNSWRVEWDDSEKQREDLAEKVKPKYSSEAVKEKSIALWDITDSCAALKVVLIVGTDNLPSYITNVRDARNKHFHSGKTKVQLGEFNEVKDVVQKLIYGAGLSLPREFCDAYQKQLDTLASCEFSVCCGCFCTVLNLILSSTLQPHSNRQNSRYGKTKCSQ